MAESQGNMFDGLNQAELQYNHEIYQYARDKMLMRSGWNHGRYDDIMSLHKECIDIAKAKLNLAYQVKKIDRILKK